jgi:hypothetical protein
MSNLPDSSPVTLPNVNLPDRSPVTLPNALTGLIVIVLETTFLHKQSGMNTANLLPGKPVWI